MMPLTAQVHARAAAAAVEPAQLLRDAARAATAAAARVDAPAVYSESESGDAARPFSGKPPRAPPRGRPGAAAVPGRRRVLDGGDRKNRKKKKEGGEPEPAPAAARAQALAAGSAGLQPGKQHGRVRGEPGAAGDDSCARAATKQGACKEGTSGARCAQAPEGQDAALCERAERKRLKKRKQKLRRAAGGLSEEQAALERARRERKKQRLKVARARTAKPVAA
jgi:hypothetical protein